ncbi:MAG: DUF393 domain-containing protein [Gemmatimonadetes bacterium]|nr:DUF393 domain-containing protein [Gemmatimonadota bacterium]MYG16137.1 DUF393 domain-containing protein [Gemmatimonadota bacterium]MYH18075.1 DUF393 domain-containing protein [Gemmatimonadota bacterium]MYK98914.1 DUF393 domain-containing protein [Gemmatimonadota bacterium]
MLFFDGVCGLCNRFVDFMLRTDSQHRFRFAPLQGETARRLLGVEDEAGDDEPDDPTSRDSQAGDLPSDEPRSFIFLDTDGRFEQSDAVLHAMARLGGAWRLIAVLYVFPRPLRDCVYRTVARNRYRWFGRRDACRLPTPEERGRFLL